MEKGIGQSFLFKVLFGAIAFSILLLIAIVLTDSIPAKVPQNSDLGVLLFGLGIVEFVLGLVLPGIVSKGIISMKAKEEPLKRAHFYEALFLFYVLRLALFESVAVLGLASLFIAGMKSYTLQHFALAVVGLVISFPSENRLMSWFEKISGKRPRIIE